MLPALGSEATPFGDNGPRGTDGFFYALLCKQA
jgi:hypothetical protein